MDFPLPRGLRDIPPSEAKATEAVRDAFLDTCRLFDYKVMEPSSLELLETLSAKSGPSIKDEIYYFKDKSGRDLGLRFDLTVGLTRYVTSKRELSQPVRLGSYSSVWRYDEPQYGRYRWFYQWDAELYGPSSVEADSEIIDFSSTLFKKLGTNPLIAIGSRRILEAFIRTECKVTDETKVFDMLRAIDKTSKKSLDEIAKEYSSSFSKAQLEQLAEFTKLRGEPEKVSNKLIESRIDSSSLLNIIDALKARNVGGAILDLSIVRGIDYYTDMVFEAFDRESPRLGSLCGGGRYDSLPAIYGRPDLGATGAAGGVERAVLAYKIKRQEERRIFVAPIGKRGEVKMKAASIASRLRQQGIAAQSEISDRSLRKILESQSALGTKAVVIIGERELATDSVKIKWMESGKEETVKISELEGALRSASSH